MKIKTWLLLSYLIVMVLPLICAYGLYTSITHYYEKKKVEEYYDIQTEIKKLSKLARNSHLYIGELDESLLDEMTNGQKQMKLYDASGVVRYETVKQRTFLPNPKYLYRDFYDIQETLYYFTYKEPVFQQGELVGIFEVKVARDALVTTMKEYSAVVITLFIITFLLIYLAVAYLIHRKINRRLDLLMDDMYAFAKGHFHAERKTTNDEIGQLQEHFYTMRRQIVEAQEMIKKEQVEKEYMIATISHDLKTPLTAIKAYTEALQQGSVMDEIEIEKYQHIILDKTDFMRKMLDDLMTYTLLQSQSYRLELVMVDGMELFDMLLSDYEAVCKQKNIQLTTVNDVQGLYQVDVKECIRVVDNIMSNAVQHTQPGKGIDLLAFSSLTQVEDLLFKRLTKQYHFEFAKNAYLVIQNEGKHIEKDKIPYLFDPLFQADQARSKKDAHGTGLGLSIAKQIIEMHGGSIHVFTEKGLGTGFICAIPRKLEDKDA